MYLSLTPGTPLQWSGVLFVREGIGHSLSFLRHSDLNLLDQAPMPRQS